jgi:ribosomal protein L19
MAANLWRPSLAKVLETINQRIKSNTKWGHILKELKIGDLVYVKYWNPHKVALTQTGLVCKIKRGGVNASFTLVDADVMITYPIHCPTISTIAIVEKKFVSPSLVKGFVKNDFFEKLIRPDKSKIRYLTKAKYG